MQCELIAYIGEFTKLKYDTNFEFKYILYNIKYYISVFICYFQGDV